MAEIIINQHNFTISEVLLKHLLLLTQYFDVEWSGEPINLEHSYFPIEMIDINQALQFMELAVNNKDGLNDFHINNLAITSFIMDYFGFEDTLTLLEFATKNVKRTNQAILFIYNKKLCNRSLKHLDINQLLNYGYSLNELVGYIADDALIDIHQLSDEHLEYTPLTFTVSRNLYKGSIIGISSFEAIQIHDRDYEFIWKPNSLIKGGEEMIQIDDQDHEFVPKSNSLIKENNKPIFNKEDSLRRLEHFTENMLSSITWNNVALLGGSLSLILCTHIDYKDHVAADIDLFVWGESPEDRRITINRLLTELRQNLDIVVFQLNMVTTIIIRNKTRNIQIIDSGLKSLNDIVYDFDITTVMAGYDGKNFLANTKYLFSLRTRCCYSFHSRIPIQRIAKTLSRGFSFLFKLNDKIKCNQEDISVWSAYIKANEQIDILNDENVVYSENKYLFATDESVNRLTILFRGIFSKLYKLVPEFIELANDESWKIDYTNPEYAKLISDNMIAMSDLKIDTQQWSRCKCGPKSVQTPHNHVCGSDEGFIPIKVWSHRMVGHGNKIIEIKLSGVILNTSNLFTNRDKMCKCSLNINITREHCNILTPYRELLSTKLDQACIVKILNFCGSSRDDPGENGAILNVSLLSRLKDKKQGLYWKDRSLTYDDLQSTLVNNRIYGDIIISPFAIWDEENKETPPALCYRFSSFVGRQKLNLPHIF